MYLDILILEGQAKEHGDNFSFTTGLKNFHEPVKFTSVVVIDKGNFEISNDDTTPSYSTVSILTPY
jgi:hypothetical protein